MSLYNPQTKSIKSKVASQDAYAVGYLELMRQIMRGIVETFGHNCEVVLHDFRDPEHSIIAIEGNVTERHVGGSVTQIGLSLIAQGDDAADQTSYITRIPDGRILKSTTMILRNSDSRVFGAFCINFDVTDLHKATTAIGELAGSLELAPQPISFVDDIGEVIHAIITEEERKVGHSIDRMKKHEKLQVFRALDRRGVFALQRSVPQVAEYLGISRATAYNYLEELRAEDAIRGDAAKSSLLDKSSS